jgi:hypothetical protein
MRDSSVDVFWSLSEVNCVWLDAAMLWTRRTAHDMIDRHATSRSTIAIERRKEVAGFR